MLSLTVESNQQDHELHWLARTAPEGLIVQASGEVDAHNESAWQRMLTESAAATPDSAIFVVDGAALDFMSCGALLALAKQAIDSRQRGVIVRLVTHQRSIGRIVAVCGLDDAVSTHPDLDSALNGHRPP